MFLENNQNYIIENQKDYLSNYYKKPHVRVGLQKDENGKVILNNQGKPKITFIGFDGTQKIYTALSREEQIDWEMQNKYRKGELEDEVNMLLKLNGNKAKEAEDGR